MKRIILGSILTLLFVGLIAGLKDEVSAASSDTASSDAYVRVEIAYKGEIYFNDRWMPIRDGNHVNLYLSS